MRKDIEWRDGGTTRHIVADGALTNPPLELLAWLAGREVFAIGPQPVLDLVASRLERIRAESGRWVVLSIADGESAKSLRQAEALWQQLIEHRARRDSLVVGVGGGAATDLVGFVASTYLRGLEAALLPTTTLAQLDASVGGKCGVNVSGTKNMVGTFFNPAWVVADPSVLNSESARQRNAGLVEAIKLGVTYDGALLELIETLWPQLDGGDPEALTRVIAHGVRAKLEVVESDRTERDLRKVLNFGHTLAHALEAEDQGRALLHGEAVAYGALFALRLSVAEGVAEQPLLDRVERLLRKLALPDLPAADAQSLVDAMDKDKKADRGGLAWVLAEGLGGFRFATEPGGEGFQDLLNDFLRDPWTRA